MKRILCCFAVTAVAGAICSPVAAQEDPWRGEALAAPCFTCHGTSFEEPDEVAEDLLKFRSGERKATIMGRIAKGYSEDEIRILGEYFLDLSQGDER